MSRLRVSAISYLNTAPLMWDFEHTARSAELREEFEVKYTIPSRCAQMLADGSADIGIIPVAAYAAIPGLRIMPDVAIASRNAVGSILLVSHFPLQKIRSVALDSSSRSSAALIQILFAKYWQRQVQFASAEPDIETMLARHDAALLIGDPALQVDRSQYETWDLGEQWRGFTSKSFVYAFWAMRKGAAADADLARVAAIFNHSRDAGLEHLDTIAAEWVPRLKLSRETITSYLSQNIHYYLDEECIAGLELFFRYAAELNILPSAPELRLTQVAQNPQLGIPQPLLTR